MEIRDLKIDELAEAAQVLGRGMRDNPLHVAAFGADPSRRERSLSKIFTSVLRQYQPKGAVLGSFADARLLGVCAMVQPGRCQPDGAEKLRLLPTVFSGNSLSAGLAVLRWTSAWAKHDPREPHWHLGPVGVERELQGKGIGSELLTEFCRRMDRARELAYLETDKSENVSFYERFGFRVVGEAKVIGVPNWFMIRQA